MDAKIAQKYREYENAELAWDPVKGGKEALVCFKDSKVANLGLDPTGERFARIAEKMLSGQYYPPDAVEFFGFYQGEQRPIRSGDRILQRAPIVSGIYVWSMVEIYVAEQAENSCRIGYVTTKKHHGRGIWTATLTRECGELKLLVESIASPNTWLFWLGLPIARYLQLRARRRGIENLAAY